MKNLLFMLEESTCALNEGTQVFLKNAFLFIQYAVPVLLIVLISKDILTAVTSGKEEEMKKAQKNAIIRIIIAIVIFFTPTIVQLILDVTGIPGGCEISNFRLM